MKRTVLFIAVVLTTLFVGCIKDDPITTQVSADEQAIKSLAVSGDSISDYTQSDATILTDDDELAWSKYGSSEINAKVKIFKWGRRITSVQSNVNTTFYGDTLAVAMITKILAGNLVIVASYSDTASRPDTTIRKPFQEQILRKAVFKRVANTANAFRNWKPVAVSLGAGVSLPDSINKFSIQKLEVVTSEDTFTVTDPLGTMLELKKEHHRGIPWLNHNDNAKLRITVQSSNDSAEAVAVRWEGEFKQTRDRMTLVSTVELGGGVYLRTYEKSFRAFVGSGKALGRYNIVADVNSWGTLHDDSQPVSNEVWGFPYNTKRR